MGQNKLDNQEKAGKKSYKKSNATKRKYCIGWHEELLQELQGFYRTYQNHEVGCDYFLYEVESEKEAIDNFLDKELDHIIETDSYWYEEVKEKAAKRFVQLSIDGDDLPEGFSQECKNLRVEINDMLEKIANPNHLDYYMVSSESEQKVWNSLDIDKIKRMFSDEEVRILWHDACFFEVLVIPLETA